MTSNNYSPEQIKSAKVAQARGFIHQCIYGMGKSVKQAAALDQRRQQIEAAYEKRASVVRAAIKTVYPNIA